MAEEKLEGFEDFDNVLGEGQADEKVGAQGELDDLLGKEAAPSAPAAGGGDSELDSFFEDLSTIDDLEVQQEEPKPSEPVAAPAAAAAPSAPAAREERPSPVRARPARGPSKPRRWPRYLAYLIFLGLLGAGGYYGYTHYWLTKGKLPWPVFKTTPEVPPPVVQPPPQPPPVAAQPPAPRPRVVVKPPPKPHYAIQVATCFFASCVSSYRDLLTQAGYPGVRLKDRVAQTQTLELYSLTTLDHRQAAQEWAERINNDNHVEGHAYVLEEGKVFRLSLGEFSDLARANLVMDALNQRYRGQMVLAHRVKAMPYDLKILITGAYPTRPEADQALAKLQALDRNLAGAFVVPY